MQRLTRRRVLLIVFGLPVLAVGGLVAARVGLELYGRTLTDSNVHIGRWFREPDSRPALTTTTACEDAPFILPSEGFIGLLWGDPAGPYTVMRRHTAIDIFGNGAPGTVPIIAAYDGYLTRLDDWRSTVIIRHDDPLQPGRTIWTYYTHMASRDGAESFIVDAFPPGTHNVFVEQGTLLGYQGEYAGPAGFIGMHLHFSIVLSDDEGVFKNEAVLANTLDPTPYFGMPLNIGEMPARPIRCPEPQTVTPTETFPLE